MRPFDESDLIAYHLHELPPQEEKALRYALHNNPALAAESSSIAAILAEYKHHSPFEIDTRAMERNWAAVRNALPHVPVAPSPFFRWRLPVFAGAGLALALPIFFAVRHPDVPELQQEIAHSRPADAATTATTAPSSLVPNQDQRMAAVTETPLLRAIHHKVRDTAPRSSLFPPATPVGAQQSPQPATTTAHTNAEPIAGPSLPSISGTPSVPSAGASDSQSSNATASTSATAAAQTTKAARNASRRHTADTDLTLSIGGTFIGTRGTTNNGITNAEGSNHSVATIGSFHQQFRPFVGYRVTVSYTRPDFRYDRTISPGATSSQYIYSNVYELAGTYVARGPRRGRVDTYVEAGAGMMAFLPRFTDTGNRYNISPAGIVGVSADVPVTKHFGVHAAYRAQVFKGPDFHANTAIYSLANSKILISQEPSVGITYRFIRKQQQ